MDTDATGDLITIVPRKDAEPEPPRRDGRWSSSRVRRIAPVSRSHAARLALFTLLIMLVSISTVAIDWGGSKVELQADEIATETLKAPETVTFESELRTAERRQEAYADERNVVETYDQSVRTSQLSDLQSFLSRAETIRNDSTKTTPARADDLRAIREDLDDTAAQTIVGLPQASWERVKREADRLVDGTLSVQVRADEIARLKEDLSGRVSAQMTSSEQAASLAIARSFVSPNVFVDDAQTLANRQKAAAAVDPVMVTVQAGQAVVRDGDPVTKYDVEKLQHLGLLTTKVDGAARLGKAGLMAVLTIGLTIYLYAFNRRLWQGRQIILVALIVLGPIVAGRLILPSADIQYMFPAAASAMLFAILVDFQFAAVMSAVLALYLGVVAGMSFELAFVYFVASVTGAFLVWGADRTITFVWAGFGVALASFAVAVCFEALSGSMHSSTIGSLAVQTIMAGVLSAAVTFLSFSLLARCSASPRIYSCWNWRTPTSRCSTGSRARRRARITTRLSSAIWPRLAPRSSAATRCSRGWQCCTTMSARSCARASSSRTRPTARTHTTSSIRAPARA